MDEKTYRLIVDGDAAGLKAAIEAGDTDPKAVNYGDSWLHLCAEHGFGEGATLLLEHGVDPNILNERGDTPLIVAVVHKKPAVIPPLLAGGADPEIANKIGAPPAQYVVKMNAGVEITQTSWEMIDGVKKETVVDQRPRYEAAMACLRHLLAGGAKPDAESGRGMNGLHVAAGAGDLEFATTLIEGGASVSHANANGFQPIHAAAGAGKLEMVKLLLDKGADASAADTSGFTPLHDAAAAGNEELVTMLVANGADKTAKVIKGWKDITDGMNAQEIAKVKGHDAVAALLN